MACVAAFDNDANNALNHDKIDENIDHDSYKLESSNNGGTLDELINVIQNAKPGDEINLNYDYDCSQVNKTNGMYVFDNVTINGHGHSFNGNESNMSNLFIVYGDNVVLKNMKFINWDLSDDNNIILWGGLNGTIINCTFINNRAFDGEMIDWIGSNGSLYDSNFLNNTANFGSNIYWNANYGRISNCNFSNNSAENGGAIIWIGKEGLIEKTNFNDNHAQNGGAVYWDGLLGTLKNNNFIHNQAEDGAAVFSDVSDLSVIECLFKDNNASDSAGAIYLSGGNAEVNNSKFINNHARCDGGAIFIDNNIVLTLFNSTFTDNSADYGGAILVEGELYVIGSDFSDNTAKKMGGAIYAEFFTSVINSTFNNNVADKGGALSLTEADIVNSSFFGNEARISGGALFVNDAANIVNCTFEENNAVDGSNLIACNDFDSINVDNLTTFDDFLALKIVDVYIDVSDILYGDDLNMLIYLHLDNKIFDGQIVNITLNNKRFTEKIVNNTVNITFSNLELGNYSGYVIFNDYPECGGGESYEFNVNKFDTSLFVYSSPVLGVNSFNLSAEIDSENATGKVTFDVNGTNYTSDIKNGIASVVIRNLTPGNYLVNAIYSGDSIHNSSNATLMFKVDEYYVVITAPDVKKYYNGKERFVVSLTDNNASPIVNASITININDVNYTRVTDSEGFTSVGLGLSSGFYHAITEFNSSMVYSTVEIKTTADGSDIVKMFRNATPFTATFFDSEGKPLAEGSAVEFNINGVIYTRTTDAKGVASLNINLDPGDYIITSHNPVTGENRGNTVTVLPKIVENYDLVKYYRNASQYTVKLLGNDGNAVGAGVAVSFNINGVFYTRTTDADGVAALNINLGPGDYIITAIYDDCMVSNNIKVLPTLKAEDLSMKYRDGSKFEVNVLDGVGNSLYNASVVFNINGVLYTRISDIDGIAALNINLMPGEYIITSSYNNLNISNKITISS